MRAVRTAAMVFGSIGMLLGSGCATNRGVLNVRVLQPPNPATGDAVKIVRVTDKRVFEPTPREPCVPSLRARDIENKAITARAIARKRNGYGKAMGDIVLPEGRTVEDLVREALTKAFREAGYRVVEDSAGAGGSAVPVEADIAQFWSWVTPGFWAVSVEFEAKVNIRGAVGPFRDGETVRGYVEMHTQAAGGRAWLNTINKGIEAFVTAVKTRLGKN